MDLRYVAWIKQHYPTVSSAQFRCQQASGEMAKAFPELVRVRGWISSVPMDGPRQGIEHWWCRTAEGEVVDPTGHQFCLMAQRFYREHREGVDPVPLGKCMSCGNYCWDKDPDTGEPVPGASSCFCCEDCRDEMMADCREG